MYCNRAGVTMLALLAVGCSAPDPEGELRALVDAAEAAAEDRDWRFFGSVLAEGYSDRRGRTRDELVARLRAYFLVNQQIEVLAFVDEIELSGETAAEMVVRGAWLERAVDGPGLDVDADFYRIELELVKDGDDWRIIGADWGRAPN